MKDSEISSLINEKVDETEEEDIREFLHDILEFEYPKLDRNQPQYRDTYNEYIDRYALNEELDEYDDG
jgi:hypothetical protein